MVLLFLDYCDIVWGDRINKLLMDSLYVLQNRAAKIVLDRPVYSSSTQALLDLKWKELRVKRRIYGLIYVFKCLNGLLGLNYNFTTNSSVHNYQTSGPGSSPGRGHCVVFLGKTLYSHGAYLHPGV